MPENLIGKEKSIDELKTLVGNILRIEKKHKGKLFDYFIRVDVFNLIKYLMSLIPPLPHKKEKRYGGIWRDLLDYRADSLNLPPPGKKEKVYAGLALDPIEAIGCATDSLRTVQFIAGFCKAIEEAKKRFPHAKIKAIDIGCGPLGLLGMAAASQFDDVQFTFLDYFPESIKAVQQLAKKLGITDRITTIPADASLISLPPQYHVAVAEAMHIGLFNEPQTAITLNAQNWLIKGGIWVPEQIVVSAGMKNTAGEQILSTPLVNLTKATELKTLECIEGDNFSQGFPITRYVEIPEGFEGSICLTTDIGVFENSTLHGGDSNITYDCCTHEIPYSSELRTARVTFVLGGDISTYKLEILEGNYTKKR